MSNFTYFNELIARKQTGIPLTTQWMVHFTSIPAISPDLEGVDTQTWDISPARARLKQELTNSTSIMDGNAFAQSVTIPGERLDIQRAGIDSSVRGGFTGVPHLNARSDNELVSIDFLETNDSIADILIRPWIIQVGFQGLIATRDPNDSVRTELWAMYFDRGDAQAGTAPKIRKKFIFHNAVPVSVDPDTVDYQKNQITILKTQWMYTHYTVSTS